jgi:hypothetical protein
MGTKFRGCILDEKNVIRSSSLPKLKFSELKKIYLSKDLES